MSLGHQHLYYLQPKIYTFHAGIRRRGAWRDIELGESDRERERRVGSRVLLGSLLWHCECQTPITLIRARICMIKWIRDFNQKNPLVWKRDTLRQAHPPNPSFLPSPILHLQHPHLPKCPCHCHYCPGLGFPWIYMVQPRVRRNIKMDHCLLSWGGN